MGKTNGAAMSSCISPVNVQLHLPCVFSGFQGCYVMEHAPGMVCDVVAMGLRSYVLVKQHAGSDQAGF